MTPLAREEVRSTSSDSPTSVNGNPSQHRGGRLPLWSPNGRELFYQTETGDRVMVVPVTTEAGFSAGSPDPGVAHAIPSIAFIAQVYPGASPSFPPRSRR